MPNSAPLTSPATPSMVTGTTRLSPAPDGPSDLVIYGRVLRASPSGALAGHSHAPPVDGSCSNHRDSQSAGCHHHRHATIVSIFDHLCLLALAIRGRLPSGNALANP